MPLLQARDVSFAYAAPTKAGRCVLEGVSLDVDRGDLVGILGPNGSGKTTLLKLVGGMLAPGSGSILLDGRRLAGWPRRDLARRIAYVPQETHAPFDFTVMEIALMGRYPHLGPFALEGPDDLAVAERALDATGTASFANRRFSTLSGGEKQRVVIASALAQSPELLLLDEPTASLDIGRQLETAVLLARLNATQGVTIVLSSHDLNFAAAVCRTLVLIRDGHVLAAGPTESVLTSDTVKALYDVDADVRRHPRAGHLTVTPIARA